MEVHILAIDPQEDFMDSPGSALPVTGANADMDRAATMIRRLGKRVDDYHITQDSHHDLAIFHSMFWLNGKNQHPQPLTTVITASDISAEIWRPRNGQAKPRALGGKTISEYCLWYSQELEKGSKYGKYPLLIWPTHCVIGTKGHEFHGNFYAAVREWADACFATPDIVTKGSNLWTEHFGGLQAEVPLPSDPSTGLNTTILKILSAADIVAVVGEAGSHCVMSTVNQIVYNIDPKLISKFHLIVDCISPVGHYPPAPDFPTIYQEWLHKMEKLGLVLTTSDQFLK